MNAYQKWEKVKRISRSSQKLLVCSFWHPILLCEWRTSAEAFSHKAPQSQRHQYRVWEITEENSIFLRSSQILIPQIIISHVNNMKFLTSLSYPSLTPYTNQNKQWQEKEMITVQTARVPGFTVFQGNSFLSMVCLLNVIGTVHDNWLRNHRYLDSN